MTRIKNTFTRVTDKDTAPEYMRMDTPRHVENIRFFGNGGHDGVGINIKGTQQVSDFTSASSDLKCVSAIFNEDKNVIYYFLASGNGVISKILEYDIENYQTVRILEDSQSILKFNKEGYITGINEINGLLYFSEWGNNMRKVNIDRAKTFAVNAFEEDDITVIKKPHFNKPKITLQNTDSDTQQENNIAEKFIYFSVQYRYLDGEYSALSPFSEAAFLPKNFNYDYAEQSNLSMVNNFNAVKIDFNTGSKRVTDIRLIFKESESNTEWIIDEFNKGLLGWGNDQIESFTFSNDKKYRALSNYELPKRFDNVPRTAKAQTFIGNRMFSGNYLEQYNIEDSQGNKIKIDFGVRYLSSKNVNIDGSPKLIPKRTVKSNRDYEVLIEYEDEYGRITTGLNSPNNTVYIPNKESISQNKIAVSIYSKPPYFAKYYRFLIKQSTKGYDQILPTLFYEDGVYRWVKLEGSDIDKVKEGDHLIVKSDSQGVLNSLVKVKVLEVTRKEDNFLQPLGETDQISERGGNYFKIKQFGFRIDKDDFDNYVLETYDNSRREYNNPVRALQPYISKAHFYGDSLNDLTTSGTFTGASNDVVRYLVKIDRLKDSNGNDSFKWSNDDGATFEAENINIIAGQQYTLEKGVKISFANESGHSTIDEWVINARATFSVFGSSRSYAFLRVIKGHGETLPNSDQEVIQAGARILFTVEEYGRGSQIFTIDEISSQKYDDIEEWFHKEDIFDKISAQSDYTIDDLHFVKGVIYRDDSATQITQNDDQGVMTLLVRSKENGTGAKRVKTSSRSEVTQTDGDTPIIFETEPEDQTEGIFYEIGQTYKVENGVHKGNPDVPEDTSQTSFGLPAIITLDFFNAYTYGNGVESYKIKDGFNRKGLDVGIRTSSIQKDDYREMHRKADVTWSDVYQEELGFNGLSSFNLPLANFVTLDKEEGSIQRLEDSAKNLLVMQQDAIGLIPYNKNIIEDVQGGQVVGISTNVLDEKSYRPYSEGLYGISDNPEGYVQVGNRKYMPDYQRGRLLRLSTDGITEINNYGWSHGFSEEISKNRDNHLVGGYDPEADEYLLYIPSLGRTIAFSDKYNGFPLEYKFEPDFILNANNKLFSWKNGVMYQHGVSTLRNKFYDDFYPSRISFFSNTEPDTEKIAKAIILKSRYPYDVNITSDLTSTDIPKEHFVQVEDFWYADIMGNTNSNRKASATFGIGSYEIVNGEINATNIPETLSVGDRILSANLLFSSNKIIDIQNNVIYLENKTTTNKSFLMYEKNQKIEGSPIRGNYFQIDLVCDRSDETMLRGVELEVIKSYNGG